MEHHDDHTSHAATVTDAPPPPEAVDTAGATETSPPEEPPVHQDDAVMREHAPPEQSTEQRESHDPPADHAAPQPEEQSYDPANPELEVRIVQTVPPPPDVLHPRPETSDAPERPGTDEQDAEVKAIEEPSVEVQTIEIQIEGEPTQQGQQSPAEPDAADHELAIVTEQAATPEIDAATDQEQPLTAEQQAEVPEEIDPFISELPDNLPPRYLAFLNQKGGVGKTTSTVNLGAALAKLGKRILLIDLDPQAHLTLHLGIEPGTLEVSLYDLLTDDDTSAMEIVQEVKENLFVLPAEVNLAGVESELASDMMTGRAQRVLRDKCRGLLESTPFDFIMIDCPPSLGLLTINALTLANEVVVPMQAHFLALQGLSKLLETVHLVRQGFNPQLSVAGIVLCMHERQTLLAGEIQNDLTEFLQSARGTDQPWANAEVFTPPVRRNIKLAESPSFGQSIFEYAPDCHGASDYKALAKSILRQSIKRLRRE